MPVNPVHEPIDYLVLGHVTKDLKPSGFTLGGTVSYASLTAHALGQRVGVLTSCTPDFPLDQLDQTNLMVVPASATTTFENIYHSEGRVQVLHDQASKLQYNQVPAAWKNPSIVHFGPVDQEISIDMIDKFPDSFIGITPQGWFRKWDHQGHVSLGRMHNNQILGKSSAVVISIEDVNRDETYIDDLVRIVPVMVVTEGAAGARLYWNGDMRYFRPPSKIEVDPTGAGDIFAAAFFFRFHATGDAWEAARFATILAANSVTRVGLDGIPTPLEIKKAQSEIFSRIDQL